MIPSKTKTLILNQDFSPLNTVNWKKGIKLTFESLCLKCHGSGKIGKLRKKEICPICNGSGIIPPARVVEYYDLWLRDSKGNQHPVPAVISNSHHVKRIYKTIPFSKKNVYRRDNFTCQYCGQQFPPELLTQDHVIPRSIWCGEGSCTCWKNIVAACVTCNRKKADRTPEQAGMPLKRLINGVWITYKYPKQPNYKIINLGLGDGKPIPKEWIPYIGQ